ncbi:hypothetical protein Tco_0732412 [Tanacetum coccineum]
MAAHSKIMERFENAIFKQREEINGRMTEMFRLLKELMTSKAPEKVLIREEAKFLVTKNVNSISLSRGEEERSEKADETLNNIEKPTVTKMEIPSMEVERSNETKNKPIKKDEMKEVEEVLSSWPEEYYLKHRGSVYEAILKKKITKKEDVEGNFKIPCSIGGLKHVNALIDQGSDVNVMPYSTYMKLTNKMPAETDIRLSLASHSYIYPLGIAEDVLVEAAIKFDKGIITLRSRKSKISFHKASPVMGRKDKASLEKGDEVQPIEEQKFQRQASHSYYNQGRNERWRRSHVIFDEKKLGIS